MMLPFKSSTGLALLAAGTLITLALLNAVFAVHAGLLLLLEFALAGSALFAAILMLVHYRHLQERLYSLLAVSLLAVVFVEILRVLGMMAANNSPDIELVSDSSLSIIMIRLALAASLAAGLRLFRIHETPGKDIPFFEQAVFTLSLLAAVVAALERLFSPDSQILLPAVWGVKLCSQLPLPLLLFCCYRLYKIGTFRVFAIQFWLGLATISLVNGQFVLWFADSNLRGLAIYGERLSMLFACVLILIGTIWSTVHQLATAEQRALNLVLVNEEVQSEIEERQWTEELLKESRLFAESIVESIREPLLVVDSDLKIIRANHAFYATFDFMPVQTLNRSLVQVGEGQWHQPGLQNKLSNLVNKGTPFENYEMAANFKNIGAKTILLSARKIDQKDVQINLFLLAMYDITELKLAQEQARRLARGIESAADSIMMTDTEGVIQYINPSFTKLTGYDPGELLGKKPEIFQSELEPGSQSQQMWDTILAGKVWSGETTNRKKDGSHYEAYITIAPLFDELNKLEGFVSVQNDITGLKRTEEQLALRAEELARSNAELEQFAYIASHDLQEPLRMVSSYCQLLQRRYRDKLDSDALEFIEYAVDGAKWMQKLINDLLEYSRVGTRGEQLKPTKCSLALDKALGNLKLYIEDCDAKITTTSLPKAIADETQLVQLFQNLVGNALKFSGKTTPEIRVGSRKQNGEWLFFVKDNGIGIDQAFADRIFVIFQRLHTRKEYPGTGIGLALCKKIVERHGGSIWVDSENGVGSTFYFTLPRINKKLSRVFKA